MLNASSWCRVECTTVPSHLIARRGCLLLLVLLSQQLHTDGGWQLLVAPQHLADTSTGVALFSAPVGDYRGDSARVSTLRGYVSRGTPCLATSTRMSYFTLRSAGIPWQQTIVVLSHDPRAQRGHLSSDLRPIGCASQCAVTKHRSVCIRGPCMRPAGCE